MTVIAHDRLEALFDELSQREGSAEIVNGKIVPMSPTGPWPGYAADEIYSSLRLYVKRTGRGIACADSKIFRVDLPNRQSFSPDAAYFLGTQRAMKHYNGSPILAVEVRSSGDYGPRAERLLEAKRNDYFAAGTQVVWDMDLLSPDVIRGCRAVNPETTTIYRPGDIAEAEPAVPDWTLPMNDVLPPSWRYPFQDDDQPEKV